MLPTSFEMMFIMSLIFSDDYPTLISLGTFTEFVIDSYYSDDQYYSIYQVGVPEIIDDSTHAKDYSLLINWEADINVDMYICNNPTQVGCEYDAYVKKFSNQSGFINQKNYAKWLNVKQYFIYIMVIAKTYSADHRLKIRVDAAILLDTRIQKIQIQPLQTDMFFMYVNCESTPFKMTISDPSFGVCVQSQENEGRIDNKSLCMDFINGTQQFLVRSNLFYTLFTVHFSNVMQPIQFGFGKYEDSSMLFPEITSSVKLFDYPLCHKQLIIQFNDSVKKFAYTQEIQNSQLRNMIQALFHKEVTHEFIIETDNLVTFIDNYSSIFLQLTLKSNQHMMPWKNTTRNLLSASILASSQMDYLHYSTRVDIKPNFVLNNTQHNNQPTGANGYLTYDLAFQSSSIHSFQVTDNFNQHGDVCEVLKGDDKCQLILDNITQTKIADDILYYVIFNPKDQVGKFIYDRSYNFRQNEFIYDYLKKDITKYYRIDILEEDEGIIYIESQNSNTNISIAASPVSFFPQYGVKIDTEQNNSIDKVQLNISKQFMTSHSVAYISVTTNQDALLTMQFLTSHHINQMLVENEPKQLNLSSNEATTVGVKVPESQQIAIIGSNTATYYSVMAVQAANVTSLDPTCKVTFKSQENQLIKARTLGYIDQQNQLLTFELKVSVLNLLNDDVLFFDIQSNCNTIINVISVGVIQLDGMRYTLEPSQKKRVVLAREFIPGIDHKISIFGTSDNRGDLYVCGIPYLLDGNSKLSNTCKKFMTIDSFMSPISNIIIDETILPEDPQFAYYTFISHTNLTQDDRKPIMVMETDITDLYSDIHHTTVMQSNQRQYFKISKYDKINQNTLFLTVDIIQNASLCISEEFISTVNSNCLVIVRNNSTIHAYTNKSYLHILLQSENTTMQKIGFVASFTSAVLNGSAVQDSAQPMIPAKYYYKRQNSSNNIFISAVIKQENYQYDKIPDILLQHKVSIYAAHDYVPSAQKYQYGEYQVGANAVVIPSNDTKDQIIIVVTATEHLYFELTVVESQNVFNIDYGEYLLVNATSAGSYNFVLDSEYSPAGLFVDMCTPPPTKLVETHLSYYHLPFFDYKYSQKFSQQNHSKGMIHATLNSTKDRQNFFLTLNTFDNDQQFFVYQAYTDARPQIPDPTIRVVENNKGLLKIVVDSAFYYNGDISYQVFVLDQTKQQGHHNTACGVRRGVSITDVIQRTDGTVYMRLNATIKLNQSTKYYLNVLVFDFHNQQFATAYRPIDAQYDMPVVQDKFKEPEKDGADFTWIAWLISAIVALIAVIVLAVVLFKKSKYAKEMKNKKQNQYKKIQNENLSKNNELTTNDDGW